MGKPLTTEEFINKAKLVHYDKYSYNKSIYVSSKKNIIITCQEHGDFKQRPNNHLNGKGCSKCGVESGHSKQRFDTETFINKSMSIHGQRYNYDGCHYKNAWTKVIIECPDHGKFEQAPAHHLMGQGCHECGRSNTIASRKLDTEKFILRAIEIHADSYDYSKTIYVNSVDKVLIICPKHGEFEQVANSHLQGNGCFQCAVDMRSKQRRSNIQQFIEKANGVHGNKYIYDKADYVNANTKVIIICNEHGEFRQRPWRHLCGEGCPKCSGNLKLSVDEFIQRANTVHNYKYDYGKVEYVNNSTKTVIICPEHGVFGQRPASHLKGHGCPKCISTVSYIGSRWLDSLGIPNDAEHREVKKLIPGRRFIVDGFVPEIDTVYEFYGDRPHGNPKTCNPKDIGPYGMMYKILYQKTIEREEIFKAAGFNMVTIWESDYRKQLIREFVMKSIGLSP